MRELLLPWMNKEHSCHFIFDSTLNFFTFCPLTRYFLPKSDCACCIYPAHLELLQKKSVGPDDSLVTVIFDSKWQGRCWTCYLLELSGIILRNKSVALIAPNVMVPPKNFFNWKKWWIWKADWPWRKKEVFMGNGLTFLVAAAARSSGQWFMSRIDWQSDLFLDNVLLSREWLTMHHLRLFCVGFFGP